MTMTEVPITVSTTLCHCHTKLKHIFLTSVTAVNDLYVIYDLSYPLYMYITRNYASMFNYIFLQVTYCFSVPEFVKMQMST